MAFRWNSKLSRWALGVWTALAVAWVSPNAVAEAPSAVVSGGDSRYESPRDFGLDIQYGFVSIPNYRVDANNAQAIPDGGKAISIALERFLLKSGGKVALGIDGTVFWLPKIKVATGGIAAVHEYEIEPYLAYRADFLENQLIVPFVKAGVSAAWLVQTGANSSTDSYYSFDYSIGGQLLLNAIDRGTAKRMDINTGINATYLIFEYARSTPLGLGIIGTGDLSNSAYRIGLRFEM